MKFIEYETSTGRILSVITSSVEPEASFGVSLLQIDDDAEIDTTQYAVRNGALVKTSETNQERLERERIKREYGEQCRRRYRSLQGEFVGAQLARDENKINACYREYDKMKAYL